MRILLAPAATCLDLVHAFNDDCAGSVVNRRYTALVAAGLCVVARKELHHVADLDADCHLYDLIREANDLHEILFS